MSYANIDWNGTGAMVQAIGSVMAIVAAIWIDQGAARRLRTDRADQRHEAIQARLAAIQACQMTLTQCADRIELDMPREDNAHLPAPIQAALKGAISTLDYYLRIPEPLSVSLVQALGHTDHAMGRYRNPHSILMFDVAERDHWIPIFRDDAAYIAKLYEGAQQNRFD